MSCCGQIQSVALSEREVTCKNCGTIHDRDINAARNIKELGRRLWLGADSKPSSEASCRLGKLICVHQKRYMILTIGGGTFLIILGE